MIRAAASRQPRAAGRGPRITDDDTDDASRITRSRPAPVYNHPAVQRFTLIDRNTIANDFAADVRRGLTASPKFLLPQYFYDALGSALFDAICHLPEYYPTRCETEILTTHAAEMAKDFGSPIRLIEIGSGSARKTRLLLDAICARQPELEYVPLDVDRELLEKTRRRSAVRVPEPPRHRRLRRFQAAVARPRRGRAQ